MLNYADGIDTSWIWDADFEKILEMNIPHVIVQVVSSHPEIACRLRVTGYPADQISEAPKRLRRSFGPFEQQETNHACYLSNIYRYAGIPRATGRTTSGQSEMN